MKYITATAKMEYAYEERVHEGEREVQAKLGVLEAQVDVSPPLKRKLIWRSTSNLLLLCQLFANACQRR